MTMRHEHECQPHSVRSADLARLSLDLQSLQSAMRLSDGHMDK